MEATETSKDETACEEEEEGVGETCVGTVRKAKGMALSLTP